MFVKASFLTTKRAYSYATPNDYDENFTYWWVETPSGVNKIVKVVSTHDNEEYSPIKGYETVNHLKELGYPFRPEIEIERLGPALLSQNTETAEKIIHLLGTDVDEYVKLYNKGEILNV